MRETVYTRAAVHQIHTHSCSCCSIAARDLLPAERYKYDVGLWYEVGGAGLWFKKWLKHDEFVGTRDYDEALDYVQGVAASFGRVAASVV